MSKQDGRTTLVEMFAAARNGDLSDSELRLWLIVRWLDRGKGCYAATVTLAAELHCSPSKVEKLRAGLVVRKWLELTFRGPKEPVLRAVTPAKALQDNAEQAPEETPEALQDNEELGEGSSAPSSSPGFAQSCKQSTGSTGSTFLPPPIPSHEGVEADRSGSVPPPPDRPSSSDRPPPILSRLARQNGRRVYPAAFERVWAAYPKRAGGNSKPDAYGAWRAQIVAGVSAEEMEDGVRRYALYCEAERMVDTRYVKQAATFFGRGEHWREDWTVPSEDGPSPEQRLEIGRKVLEALEASP